MEIKWIAIAFAIIVSAVAASEAVKSQAEGKADEAAAKAGLVQKYVPGKSKPIWVKPDN